MSVMPLGRRKGEVMKLAWIVVLWAGVAMGQTTQPSTRPTTQPTTQPNEKRTPIARRFSDYLELVDRKDRPTSKDDWTTAHLQIVKDALTEKARGKPGRIMASLESYSIDGQGTSATFDVKPFQWCGVIIEPTLYLKWSQSKAREFKEMREGDRVEVVGAPISFELMADERSEEKRKRVVGGEDIITSKDVGVIRILVEVVPDPSMVIKKK